MLSGGCRMPFSSGQGGKGRDCRYLSWEIGVVRFLFVEYFSYIRFEKSIPPTWPGFVSIGCFFIEYYCLYLSITIGFRAS